jgi:hypothetical protein
MFYVGLDIQSERIAVCALGEAGQVVDRTQVRTLEEVMRRRRQARSRRAQWRAPASTPGRRRRGGAAEAALTAT